MEDLFRGLVWHPFKYGKINPDDSELAAIRRHHGDKAAELFERELGHIAAVNGWSGGYAVVAEWDYTKDRRMPTHEAVAQLTHQYSELRAAVQRLAGETISQGHPLAEYECALRLDREQTWLRAAQKRIDTAEARANTAEAREAALERQVAELQRCRRAPGSAADVVEVL